MLAYAKNWSVLSVVVGLAFAVAVVKGDTCKPSVKGATWDFSALKDTLYVTGGDMECTYNKEEKSYQYAFSPCGNAAVDSKCKATAHCPLGGAINSAGVIQMDGTECCVAGSTSDRSFQPIDSRDRSKGVKIVLKGGQRCLHPTPTPRQTTLNLLCNTRAKEPQMTAVSEPAHCKYEITIQSIYGCPTECPIESSSGLVCAGRGICKTDSAIDAVRCYCDEGYKGKDCGQEGSGPDSAGFGGIIAVLVILFIFMIGMAGAIFYLVKQMVAYKKDSDTYMALRENDGN